MSTQNIHFQDKITDLKLSQFYQNISRYGKKFLRTQDQVQNSRGKQAISIQATEVLLYVFLKHSLG